MSVSISLDDRPLRVLAEQVSPDADGTVTMATDQGVEVELNATAAALWQLCDGKTAVSEIVNAATTFFAGSPGTIEHDIVAALDELARRHLISL